MRLLPALRRNGLVVLLACAGPLAAQNTADAWHPRSGDAWVDTWLGDMNRYAQRYREPFIDEMARYHGAPRALVVELLDGGWTAGDIYFACGIAQVADRNCRAVVEARQADPALGWDALAGRFGIAPGSAGFQRIKGGIVPTYERWARPIELDAELSRLHPQHPGAGKAQPDKGQRAQGKRRR